MKTIIRNTTTVSLYLFEDAEVVNVFADRIEIGNPLRMTLADCNSGNATLIEGVTDPGDWVGHKYLYTATGWELNPDYVEPDLAQ